jgi:3alpha(or 20beta)-hydroxysteroid dehydrogenase
LIGRLEGKVAIISGGARGQGAHEARRFVGEGAKVVIGDLLDAEGAAVATELGDSCRYVHLDVTSEASWEAAVAAAEDAFGPLSVLVNNAGILGAFATIDQMDLDAYRTVVEVNQVGTFLGIKHGARAMIAGGGGSIINISSIGGVAGIQFASAYVATKFAVRGMTKSAAMELGRHGIRVNSVHPGGVATPMTAAVGDTGDSRFYQRLPVPRIGTAEDVANMVLFLASDEAAYCTGAEYMVDGGSTAGDNAQFDL